jgi:hypothetical protein
MGEWLYDKQKRFDNNGKRWHFVIRNFFDSSVEYENRPYELYFRDDEKTEFGLLRFEKRKDNPYRNYETVITKIMNNVEFRKTLLKPETQDIWNRNWK